MSDKQKALVFILLASVLGGATQAVIKIGLVSIPPLAFAFIRFLIAGVIISPFLLKTNFFKDLKQLIPFSLLGTINIVFFILGIKTTTATIGTLLYAGVPLLTAIFLFILFGDRLNQRKKIGIALGFLGVVLVALLPVLEKEVKFSGDLLGNMLISMGVVSWSLYMAYSKKKLQSFSPFVVTSAFIWVTCIGLFPLFLIELTFYPNWWQKLTFSGALSLSYISIISTIIVYLLNQYAIKHGGSILASMQFYLLPIFAYLSAFFLLGEQLTTGLIIGGILALLGVYITTKK
ncbi:MAG: DMT family transporter [Candidatus Levybacteria bacterium]|nr:DMT family transporter [Candidatus Levybacteria bacterium]